MRISSFRSRLGIKLGVLHQHDPIPLNLNFENYAHLDSYDLPEISLITPSYNQGRFIGETVKSVINQNYPKLRYVIQDACSKDNTLDVLSSFPKDSFTLNCEPDNGQAHAINKGFQESKSEIMGWLNSDDLLLPGSLHLVGRFFQKNPDIDVIYGNRILINKMGRLVGRWILPEHNARVLKSINYIPQETLFWRRRAWERVAGHLNEHFKFALDWELLLRLNASGAKFAHLPELYGAFRIHESQKTSADYNTIGKSEIRALKLKYQGGLIQRLLNTFNHLFFLIKHIQADRKYNHKLLTQRL